MVIAQLVAGARILVGRIPLDKAMINKEARITLRLPITLRT